MGKVGDDTRATVGLLDEDNSKVRSTGQAGQADGKEAELSYNLERL